MWKQHQQIFHYRPKVVSSPVATTGNTFPVPSLEVQGIDRQIKETKWKVEEVTGTRHRRTGSWFQRRSYSGYPPYSHHGFFLDNSQGDPLHRSGILLAGGNGSRATGSGDCRTASLPQQRSATSICIKNETGRTQCPQKQVWVRWMQTRGYLDYSVALRWQGGPHHPESMEGE